VDLGWRTVPSDRSDIGEVDPAHVGPPDLILQEILTLSEVPEYVRKRLETISAANKHRLVLPVARDAVRGVATAGVDRAPADVTFVARALAYVEGTDQPDVDDYQDPLVWVFALEAESPVVGEKIVSTGGFTSSSSQTDYSKGESPRHGRRVSFFAAIRTEPRHDKPARG
jgi:hypothetical protein